jgi:lipopolysaccharide transport system ATP-binding protein
MADHVAIRATGLGKKYVIGHETEGERYVALRDVISRNTRRFRRSAADFVRGRPSVSGDRTEDFWALKDVDFEIRRGEVMGVIGRNGAGKSTLLKILSRITGPTEGRVEIAGRVASLLEVGTGFHPELSGRENIYLNGAILGMTRAEIKRKFDEIVAFAEVEKFLDTPVKRYSSGMYVRLAFAVAAHLEPEILIVDEVLAVGDAEFQKKCLGKMEEVAGHGRTVLFVSHNMASVRALSTRGLLLREGRVAQQGAIGPVISEYLSNTSAFRTKFERTRSGRSPAIKRASVVQRDADPVADHPFRIDRALILEVQLDNPNRQSVSVNVHIHDDSGALVFHFSDEFGTDEIFATEIRYCTIPAYAFNAGSYQVSLVLLERNVQIFDEVPSALSFRVERAGRVFDRVTGDWRGTNGPGMFQWHAR